MIPAVLLKYSSLYFCHLISSHNLLRLSITGLDTVTLITSQHIIIYLQFVFPSVLTLPPAIATRRHTTPSRQTTRHAWRRRSSRNPALHSHLLTSPPLVLLQFTSRLPASRFTTQSRIMLQMLFLCARPKVTCRCWLNTLQGETQKLKIFLWSVNVSEDYCDRIITCDRWIIWKWFCALMERMASLHCSHLWFYFFCFLFFLRKVLFETANAFAACLIFHLVPPLSLSASSATFYLSVSCFSSLFWLVEDVSNLTASDVMNRVNLGYLQGKTVCCV